MFKTRKDDFFAKLEERYSFLWDFPLSGTYTLFLLSDNAEASISGLCSVLSKEDSKCDFSSVCASVGTLLLRLNDKLDEQTKSNFSKKCEYLNYWIYHIIKDHLECENIGLFYERLNGIKKPFIPEGHRCDLQDFKIGKEEFLQKKTLFFHTEILQWIKNEYEGINNNDRTEYNQYLGEAYNFYKGIICSSDSQIKENADEELKNFKNIFNDTITSLKKKKIGIWQPVIPEKNESMCSNVSPRNPGELSQAGSELLGPLQQKLQEGGISGLQGTLGSGAAALTNQSTRDQDFNGNLPEEVKPNKGGTIASSLAGSCFFLGMMYKFTPMGSWINTKVLGRNKLMDNMEKNHYELLLNGVGNREMSLSDTMYRISYNSAAN
ncbi:VIR protein [Plasmodium vivax]|uniref:VIR protein n=1 Tax=Plasmodium vivax TaxID=5855 RepID=A0A1G4E3R5_PLAVI|nr:VIR protein [Plasmodium vivax]